MTVCIILYFGCLSFRTIQRHVVQLYNCAVDGPAIEWSQLRKATKFLIVVRAFNRYGEGPLSSPTSAITFEDGEDCYIYRYIKKKV
jgi:hypothetical protein